MERGRVEWVDDRLRRGRIVPDHQRGAIVHFTLPDGLVLHVGDHVHYELVPSTRTARRIVRLAG